MKHWDRGPQIWWNTFSRIPQHRRDATFPCWYKGTWSGSDNTPARDSHMGAGGEKPQEETRKNSGPGGACDDEGPGCCHQVICWASPVPAKASQGTQGCEASFQRCPAAVSGSPEGWQDPAPEVLSTLPSFHFQHRHTSASPPILGREDIRTLLGQMGRGDSSTAHDVLYCGADVQLRGDSTAVPCHRMLEAGARWQHPKLTMAELTALQTLKCSVSGGLLYKGRGLLCTSLAKASREPRKKEKTNKNFQKYWRKPVPKSPWMCIHD